MRLLHRKQWRHHGGRDDRRHISAHLLWGAPQNLITMHWHSCQHSTRHFSPWAAAITAAFVLHAASRCRHWSTAMYCTASRPVGGGNLRLLAGAGSSASRVVRHPSSTRAPADTPAQAPQQSWTCNVFLHHPHEAVTCASPSTTGGPARAASCVHAAHCQPTSCAGRCAVQYSRAATRLTVHRFGHYQPLW